MLKPPPVAFIQPTTGFLFFIGSIRYGRSRQSKVTSFGRMIFSKYAQVKALLVQASFLARCDLSGFIWFIKTYRTKSAYQFLFTDFNTAEIASCYFPASFSLLIESHFPSFFSRPVIISVPFAHHLSFQIKKGLPPTP